MEGPTTPGGGWTTLKPAGPGWGVVGPTAADVARAETVLRTAAHTAGLAAYQYFFVESSPAARAAYLAAIETESEAAALVALLRGQNG